VDYGYIKLYRKLLENPIFQNPNLLKVFIWCLLKATHKEYKQLVGLQQIKLLPGQFIYGRNKAAEELKMTPSTAHRYILCLKDFQILDIKANNKFSLVTVANWELYQSNDVEMDSKPNNKWTTNGQQMDTNKNVKNVKNKDIYISLPKELHEPLREYISMRKSIKKTMTDKAIQLLIGKLNKLAPENYGLQVAMLEEATLKNWLSVYPPKEMAPTDTQKQLTAEKRRQAEQEAEAIIEKERQEMQGRKPDGPVSLNYDFLKMPEGM
jgi:hypothetical protein